jgi:hypothetical protein
MKKGSKLSVEHKRKIGITHKGIPLSKEHREKIRLAHLGKTKPWLCGEKNGRWKGGKTPELRAGRPRPSCCEICGDSGRICFDHDHKTGKFRGWICNNCNASIGFAKDNIEILRKIIKYLEIYV